MLGRLDECVAALRRTVRPGGFIVVDDGFVAGPGPIARPGYEHMVAHEETVRRLTSHGDRVVEERIMPVGSMREANHATNRSIRRRAESLIRRHPDRAEAVRDYVRRQEEECGVLETEVIGATWLLQRASSP